MKKTWVLLLAWLFCAIPAAWPAQFSFQTFDEPNASALLGGTVAQGVSGGNIVGSYFDSNGAVHGFLYDGATFLTLDDPNSVVSNGVAGNTYFGTSALGISGGQIVGTYTAPDTSGHGFVYSNGFFTNLDDPNGFISTAVTGFSGRNFTGYFIDSGALTHGFIYNGSNFTTLDDPAASGGTTQPNGIDGGNIAGLYQNPANNGFLFDGNTYTTLDFPNAGGFTAVGGISGANVVGYYQDGNGNTHGFLYDSDTYTSFDYPGSSNTFANGISSNTIAGYYIDRSGGTHGFVATVTLTVTLPNTGSLSVTVMPPAVVTAGAQWQVDGGVFQNSGVVVNNLSAGSHTVGFGAVSGWITPAKQTVTIITNSTTSVTGIYALQPIGSLQVTLNPFGAVSAGAQWQADGGAFQDSGAIVSNLSVGRHAVSFEPVPGWTPPPDQSVTITIGATTTDSGNYTASIVPADGLILVTNGSGTIQTGKNWPPTLVAGNQYTVKALAAPENLFKEWVGGTNPPYTMLSTSASYTFTMQSGLLLEANFEPNPFLTAHGSYQGLFAPDNSDRTQTNSGSFTFILTTAGVFSGHLRVGSELVPLNGKFAADGSAAITSKASGAILLTRLQLDFINQAVNGTVSNGNGGFVAELTGFQNVFNARNRATNYAGRYTLIIPGVINSATGPFGSSYGTAQVQSSGAISFAGSLADGTPVSQASTVSANGYWPMYLSLYGGKGSLWSWNYISNGAIASPSLASWINPTNASKSADYRTGFTNQNAAVTGALYQPANQPLLLLVNGEAILVGGNLSSAISNQVTMTSFSPVTFSGGSNNLTLTINQTTGLVSGKFRDPTDTARIVKVNGVLGVDQVNAAGYFPGTTRSGAFTLIPP